MIDLSKLTGSELAAALEAEQKLILKNLQYPKLSTPIDLPEETQKQLEFYEPQADSLKLKKHLLALQQQTLSINHHNRAMLKLVELCDSDKPEVARRACMTILKLSHLDDAPDLYPYDPDLLFSDDDDEEPKKKPRKKSPAATAAAVNAAPPATPLNIENVDMPFFDFQQFHLTLPPMNIEDKPSKPHPFHLTTPFITLQSLNTLLIFILILILIPTRLRTANTPATRVSEFITHNSELEVPMPTQTLAHPLKSPTMSTPSPDLFATVALDQPVDATYTYSVPAQFHRDANPGSRVTVPLGRSNRPTPATILSLSTTPPELPPIENRKSKIENDPEPSLFQSNPELITQNSEFKPLLDLHRDILPIPPDLLDLGKWISTYYCSPIGSTLATMVPAAVKKATRLPANLSIHLADPNTPAEEQFGGKQLSPKTKKIFQQLHFLLQEGPKPEHEVLTQAQIARPMLKRLLALNLLRMERDLKLPDAHILGAEIESQKSKIETLSPDQQTALSDITATLNANTFAVRLLHGVTGSGKTEVYIRAIQRVVDAGKRAIVLVPEISLTPQTVRRFTARFPRVAVLHSGMKDSERHQHWHAIASGWAQVIVGARSAIFAPAKDIGIIVVDEEHDPSYKQDNLPKYHGRDVAIRRAQMLNIPIVLGSATPALESWQNAQPTTVGGHKDWKLLSLTSRPLGTAMPRVLTVDMKSQSKERRGLHILSTTLEHHLRQTLDQKKQAIFLLNRRGYAHYVMCPRCDWVLMCDNCDATMVVHRKRADEDPHSGGGGRKGLRGKVQCHYCLTAMMLPDRCPLCQARLTHLGQGTQRAEDELIRKFPSLRLKRMDSDSMNNARDYQETLDAFGHGEIDLLIGTQMISKGLDFPNVQLVGVLNSDLAMTIPDFRAAERTFQLICQVAGRSGRASERGTVIVQTFQPHEPAILHACNHDYFGFVQSELPHRREFGYPPYGRLVRIVLSHKSYTKVHTAAADLNRLAAAITQKLNLPIRITGPFPPPMERLVELYRVELIFFATTPRPLQTLLANLRTRGLLAGHAKSGAAGIANVGINVDVDPLHMM